ncbi:patatin-like phospholipase family protein [Ancylobacter radicis]|uniref:patatin-like phospholipase family protein n=1 Tax=Ancylobacter radicis TaxID=2836179 RepID=UPI00350F6F66
MSDKGDGVAEDNKPARARRAPTARKSGPVEATLAVQAAPVVEAAPADDTAKAGSPAPKPAPARRAAAKRGTAPVKAEPVTAAPAAVDAPAEKPARAAAKGSSTGRARKSAPDTAAAPAPKATGKTPASKTVVPKSTEAATGESKPSESKPSESKPTKAETAEAVAGALATPSGPAEVKREGEAPAHHRAKPAATLPKPLNLALQGGGAHGAFTWGVLDRLLEDERIAVEGISGTSAGAMNAAVLATGLAKGGNEGGRRALEAYWRDVSKDGRTSPLQRTLLDRLMGNWSLNANPSYIAFDMMSRFLSPYDFNPLNINPLMELIERHVDFVELQSCRHVHVFISATNVHTGKARVFARHELTPQAIMASACLPFMFQAVEIDGVPYWDGGYMGNPALYPFYNAVKTDDILLVQINPIIRRETPKTARDISNRMNEITFNASLLAQLRAAEFVTRLLEHGSLKKKGDGIDGYRDLRLHRIDGAEKLVALDASTKMNAEWEFLVYLRDIGREAAEAFLERHFDDIGVRSTLDVREELRRS